MVGTEGGVEIQLYSFLMSVVNQGVLSNNSLTYLPVGRGPGAHCVEGLVGPMACLERCGEGKRSGPHQVSKPELPDP